MTKFVPIFPLELIVFPNEHLNLHIFEPKYKALVKDCLIQNKEFGIIPVIKGKLKEFGTIVEIRDIAKEYEDGKYDIKTVGSDIFRVLEIMKSIPDKEYSGAIVNILDKEEISVSDKLSDLITSEVIRLFKLLDDGTFNNKNLQFNNSYEIAHKVGFTIEEEYELLQLKNELHRQEYIRRHLKKLEPTLNQLEAIKEKIKMNGHFRQIPGTEFE